MRIEIEFDTDGAAFTETPLTESSRLVREVATLISVGDKSGRFWDAADNSIGTWTITDE